ncbi:MAG: glycosyltransferase family 4 protein [Verrucomicrobiota bacterium]|nr:glycosyltransferase family 4 protein [Verrucomicrobiota bacterium]
MKILHLYSDWKWTGPAEVVIQMCQSLEDLGHEVIFACRATPQRHKNQEETIEIKAAEYGINFTTQFALNRYLGFRDTVHDIFALPKFIKKEKIDVVHTHLSHDHGLGVYLAKIISERKTIFVKSIHKRKVLKDKFWNKVLLKETKKKQGILLFSETFKKQYIKNFSIPPQTIGICPMPLDLTKFNLNITYTNQREKFNIPEFAPLIGIVARYQKYRRMDVFINAARKVVDEIPETKFIIIGRSGQMNDTVIKPMKEMGLEKNFILPGYLIDNYVDTLATLDIFTLMMPGFDGTARALREAMALGVPCVASDVGMLPDIVQHEKTGLLFPLDDSNELAECWIRLIKDKEELKKMGQTAAKYAEDNFRINEVGLTLAKFYEGLFKE